MVLSIGGMGSGIDSAAIVQQLMSAERAPQAKLQAAKSAAAIKSGAWTTLGNLMTALKDKATALKAPDALRLTAATSSDSTRVGVTASGTAAPGSLTFSVEQLATRHQGTASFASTTTPVGTGSLAVMSGSTAIGTPEVQAGDAGVTGRYTVVITDGAATVNGEPVPWGDDAGTATLSVGGATLRFTNGTKDGTAVVGIAATRPEGSTLSELSATLQGTGGPATSAVLDLRDGTDPVRLVLTSTQSGKQGELVTSASPGLAFPSSLTPLTAAQDALVRIGDLTAHRPENTVSDLLPGVTLNLLQAEAGRQVTVSTSADQDAVVAKVRGLTESLNNVLSWVRDNSKYNIATKSGGPMVGDAGVRGIPSTLFSATATGQATGTHRQAGDVGVTVTREGNLSLDETRLRAALSADPASVQALIGGIAAAVAEVAKQAGDAGGVVHTGKASTESRTRQLQAGIDTWDLKLVSIKKRYDRQFAALDVAMSRMNSQSSWLAGQINSLPSGS